jgi:nitric oxide reductase subunit B
VLQALESFNHGFWSARSLEFYQQPLINKLLWVRILPDSVFIAVGILPLAGAAVYGLMHLRAVRQPAGDTPELREDKVETLVEV